MQLINRQQQQQGDSANSNNAKCLVYPLSIGEIGALFQSIALVYTMAPQRNCRERKLYPLICTGREKHLNFIYSLTTTTFGTVDNAKVCSTFVANEYSIIFCVAGERERKNWKVGRKEVANYYKFFFCKKKILATTKVQKRASDFLIRSRAQAPKYEFHLHAESVLPRERDGEARHTCWPFI